MRKIQTFVSLLLVSVMFYACRSNTNLLIWDVEKEYQDMTASGTLKDFLKECEKTCDKPAISVTNKDKTFAPDVHYYCSIGTYWWPDPHQPGVYVRKDGQTNPEGEKYDIKKLTVLARRCRNLSKAYFFTRDRKYYDTFISQLQVWFINEDTRMYPSFEYAQVIPGRNENKGRSTGMIDAYYFNTIIESIRLVNGVKQIDRRTMRQLREWFGKFVEDSENRYGEVLRKANNNIGTAYDITLVNMYLFIGNEKKAMEIINSFYEKRVIAQILEDGRQPSELSRTKAFTYSIKNLGLIIDFCYLARCTYPNYFQEHRERIDKAFEFLGQYVNNPERFPYKQITSWESCKNSYYSQLKRLDRL